MDIYNLQEIKIMIFEMKYTLVVAWLITIFHNVSSFSVLFNKTNLTPYTLKDDWQTIERHLPSDKNQAITELGLIDLVLTEEGLNKLLEYNLSQLKVLNITDVSLDRNLTKILFSQPFFKQLEEVRLKKCSLISQDFSILQSGEAKWKILKLTGNFIDQVGFKYLSRLKFNLEKLLLSQNCLAQQLAVKSIISYGLKNLNSLSLSQSSISSDNLLKILRQTNTSNLRNLTMGNLKLPVEFFRQFSVMNFQNMELLDISGLQIDEDAVPFLETMSLPSLQTLIFANNYFTTQDGKRFFKKSIMPKLQRLVFNVNFFDALLFKHFKDEGFKFKTLYGLIFANGTKPFTYLTEMDLSLLQVFDFPLSVTFPDDFESFIKNSNFTSLKHFTIPQLFNTGNVFKLMMDKNLTKLQTLEISKIGQLTKEDILRSNVFPILSHLKISLQGYSTEFIVQFIKNIKIFAPQLQKFTIEVDQHQQIQLHQKITSGFFNNFGYKLELVISGIIIKIQPNNSALIKQWNQLSEMNIQDQRISSLNLNESQYQEQKKKFLNKVITNLNFAQLEILVLNEGQFLRSFIQNNKSCVFKNLTALAISNFTQKTQQILQKCQFPILRQLTMLVKQKIENKVIEDSKNSFLPPNKFQLLQVLKIVGQQNHRCDNYIQMFKQTAFKKLSALSLSTIALKEDEFKEIFGNIQNNDKIRSLSLSNNFIKNISVVTNIDFTLKQLDLSSMIFGDNLIQLCNLNTNFLYNLDLSQTGIHNQNLIEFLECKKAKGNVFPRLQNLDLSQNYIESEGAKRLFEIDLPLLFQLGFQFNNDPQIFNTIFSSENSKRMYEFSSNGNYLDSINAQIPQKNVRRVIQLLMNTDSLRDIDFQNLGKLSFYSLIQAIFLLKKVGSCESLKNIRKISKNVIVFGIMFEDSPLINDDCLEDEQFVKTMIPYSLRMVGPGYYASIPKFFESFINPRQYLEQLIIDKTYVSNEKLIEMGKFSSLQNLQALWITQNQLNNEAASLILNKQYKNMKALALGHNQGLTGEALSNMKNFTFSNVKAISLSFTSIGDKGIQYLVTNQFPQLSLLELVNSDITKQGILLLNRLKAPKLLMIDLSCNDLTADDVAALELPYSRFPSFSMLVLYPTLLREDLERLMIKFNRLDEKRNIVVLSDVEQIGDEDILDLNTEEERRPINNMRNKKP